MTEKKRVIPQWAFNLTKYGKINSHINFGKTYWGCLGCKVFHFALEIEEDIMKLYTSIIFNVKYFILFQDFSEF